MKKLLFGLLIVTLLVLPLFSACTEQAPPTTAPAPAPAPTTAPAPAAEVIKMKYSGFLPEPAGPSQVANFMMDYVEKNSGGRVKFERYHGGVLGAPPEQMKLVTTGSVDFGGGMMTDAEFPLHASYPTFIPGGVKAGSDLQHKLYVEIPETSALLQKEITDNNLKYFGPTNSSENGFIAKFNFSSLADLKGKKIGVDSGRVQTVVNELGMVGVVVQIPDMYEALARGLVDGSTLSLIGMAEMKWFEVTKCYMSDGTSISANTLPMLNLNTWNRLPADIQKVFLDSAGPSSEFCVKYFEEGNNKHRQTLRDAGLVVGDLSEADKTLLFSTYIKKWYQDSLETAGKQGKAEQAKLIWKYASEAVGGLPLPE